MSLPSLIFDFVPRTPPSWSWKVYTLHGRTLYNIKMIYHIRLYGDKAVIRFS